MKRRLWLCAFALVLLASPAVAGDQSGSLVIIGGALRLDATEIWSSVVDLAGGKGAKIAVFPTASSLPLENGGRVVETLRLAGADAFLVPVAHSKMELDCKQAVSDAKLVDQVRSAGGVYFIGGDQAKITRALRQEDQQNTPMLEAVLDVYRKGGVIAGSSAGAAVMSHVMCRDIELTLPALKKGTKSLQMGKEIDRGLGLLDASWFVDQHFLVRGRFARSLLIMLSQGLKYGVGVDENTALVVRNGCDAKVIGYKGAVVMDLSGASCDEASPDFNVKNVKLSYLDHGDAFDLHTLKLTPSEAKQSGQKIDPNSPEFKPYHRRPMFYNDILANTTMPDVMCKLIEHKDGQAIGLAFDGLEATAGTTRGFEFRFYRAADSLGWYSGVTGGENHTVANIRLDVRPVDIGPLYK